MRLMQSTHASELVIRAAHSRVVRLGEVIDFDEVITPGFGTPYSLEAALGLDAGLFEPAQNQPIEAIPRDEFGLRTDGPTIEEYVAAGYDAKYYPPQDYAEKASPGLDAHKASQASGASAAATGEPSTQGSPVTANVVEMNAAAAVEVIRAATTTAELDGFAAAEVANPKHPEGRVSVMRAIEERRQALTGPAQ